jgi:hypothetical protein
MGSVLRGPCCCRRSLVPRGVSLTFGMIRPARLGLLALLRALRSAGNALKSFILRLLLFWPRVLHSLRRIWPLCPRTSPKGIPKKSVLGGHARPSFPGASGCEGYSIIYASRDPISSEPHFPLGSGSTEVLHLGPIVGQSQTAPHSTASESSIEPPPPSPPRLSDRHFPRQYFFHSQRRRYAISACPSYERPSYFDTLAYHLNAIRRGSSPASTPFAIATTSHFTSADYTGKRCGFTKSSSLPAAIPTPVSISFPISTTSTVASVKSTG